MKPRRLTAVAAEEEVVRAHGVGVSLDDARTESMAQFVRWDKEATLAAHAEEVESWKRHASELGDKIRDAKRREDRLYLVLFGLTVLLAYFLIKDVGCQPTL